MSVIVIVALMLVTVAVTWLVTWLTAAVIKRNAYLIEAAGAVPEPKIGSAVWLAPAVLLCLTIGWYYGGNNVFAKFIAGGFLIWLLIIAIMDIKYQFIFDDLLVPFAVCGGLATPWLQVTLLERCLGLFIGFGVMYIIALGASGALGGGDIKFIAVIGWWLGVDSLPVIICTSFMLGGIVALGLLLSGRKRKTDCFAYGPCLIAGTVVYLVTASSIF